MTNVQASQAIKPFQRISISSSAILDYPATKRILHNLVTYGLAPAGFDPNNIEIIDTELEAQKVRFQATLEAAPNNDPVALGKRHLHLTTQPGTSMKQCPGTNNMLCCHYHIVNMVSNCPFDCEYCYLQTYLNQPLTTFYVNEDVIFDQVRAICARPPVSQLRIGTGELADSLALDHITGFSERLATIMGEYENVRLELKTKSKNVEHLLHLPRKDHVVISFSINPKVVIDTIEHGTARFEERLLAAKTAALAGFSVGFHFDPMIYIEDWKEHYSNAVKAITETVPQDKILWISIGGLRYLPHLKTIAQKRRPESRLFDNENVQASDGKVRYPRATRTEMFKFLNDTVKQLAPNIYTYLCMETKTVWEKSLEKLPDRNF